MVVMDEMDLQKIWINSVDEVEVEVDEMDE